MTDHAPSSATNVHIAPTLHFMAGVYALSRDGGPKSPRFAAYVSNTEQHWGIVPYNPMAGDAALDAVNALIAMDAETVAEQVARDVATSCGFTDSLTLAIAVRSKGLWTDRIATEVDERVTGKTRVAHRGVVSIWSREESTPADVAREVAAEAVRTMWNAQHGSADTLTRVLACEGLAYALASAYGKHPSYHATSPAEETVAVIESFEVLGDTTQAGEIAGVLYGDDAVKEMGWTPLGIPAFAGYRWAVQRAAAHVANVGAERALRAGLLP